ALDRSSYAAKRGEIIKAHMPKGFQLSIAPLLMLVLIAEPSLAQRPRTDYRDLQNVVLRELRETNTPGAAIAIVRGGRVIYTKGFGISNVETRSPVTPNMLFRVGSITKMLTATVLVSLSEEGKIALDAPVGDFVEGFDTRLSRLTAHQLLSHSAGIIDYAHTCCAQDESALATQVRAYKDADYFFTEPGRIFSYSNPSYHIAGYIIQELTGKPYADAMDERLFRPLGMTRTTYRPTVAMTFPLSQGHDAAGTAKPTIVRPFVNNVGDWPSGYVYTNVSDLARFAIAFMNGGRIDGKQVLSPSVIATLSTAYVDVPFSWDVPPGFFERARYGHGFFIQEHRGVHLLHHGGTINGFGAFVVIVPEHRFAVIIFANRTGAILSKSLEKALELSLPLKPKLKEPRKQLMPMTLAEMDNYAGTYVNGALKIELLVRNGKLFRKELYPTTIEGGPGRDFEAPVTKVGMNRFAFTPPGETAPAEFVLVPGPSGRPEYLHSFMEAARRIEARQ
ncbi:MAG: beta-lactamase family protein, partial [Acidobacteria bacterium]|nr:beta-lactamase family protein [Acidobacteriota bacterium]